MNRKKQLLSVLVLVLVGSLVYSFVRFPREERASGVKSRPVVASGAPRRRPAAPAAPAAAPAGRVSGERLRLELLNQELPRSAGAHRNIFSPIFRDEVKPPPFKPLPPPKLPLPPPPPVQPLPVQAQQPPPPPPPPDVQEMARFTFLGFLKKGAERTIFLSSDKEIYLVKQGSTIAGKFDVTNLTDDAITITSRLGKQEMVIPLVENRPLMRKGR